jgi:lipopolysaccharide/colanic/teichoic acid biosynthesis glycosyltransferase
VSPARRVPYDYAKRALDVVASGTLLIISLPLQIVVGLFVALKLGRPILFRQPRPGRDGVVFTLLKFRTMRDFDDAAGLTTDAQRLTPFGRMLRSTSLDELPSLVNVLKGDMSMVGPRPLLVHYLDRYTATQARRHEVRPGITGLAQANGRNALGWARKFELDVDYVDSRSLRLDLKILFATAAAVLRRDGVSAAGHATAHEFTGGAE